MSRSSIAQKIIQIVPAVDDVDSTDPTVSASVRTLPAYVCVNVNDVSSILTFRIFFWLQSNRV